jgi:hypothetical protein
MQSLAKLRLSDERLSDECFRDFSDCRGLLFYTLGTLYVPTSGVVDEAHEPRFLQGAAPE